MDLTGIIAKELNIQKWQVEAVVKLLDEGNTVPFIARYRKEAHGALNDEVLRALYERLTYLRGLDERRASVLSSIKEQGKLTDELRQQIDAAMTQTQLEDLYRPYKQKRRTRAMIAREKGLQPLADYILNRHADHPVEKEAARFVDPEKEIPDAQTAIMMAEDIIAGDIADNAQYRGYIRSLTMHEGVLVSTRAASRNSGKTDKNEAGPSGSTYREDKSSSVISGKSSSADNDVGSAQAAPVNKKLAEREHIYDNFFDYSEPLEKIPGHRILAVNRGEKEGFLSVHIEAPAEKIIRYLVTQTATDEVQQRQKIVHSFRDLGALAGGPEEKKRTKPNPVTLPFIEAAVTDAYKRLIAPSIENEIRSQLTDTAEDGAIGVFRSNLAQLLLQPPVEGRTVLGWDPAFRTGCKLAVVDPIGKVLDTAVIFPTAPQNKVTEAEEVLDRMVRKYNVDVISVGNGTASRESEQIIADFIHKESRPVSYAIVNEAGASVYSASRLATEEFPLFDVGQRSAVSIARRLQDPLAELVKIDPRSIGVGQYQHDMNQTKLGEALTGTVEDCVNSVGVDVNTASAALLSYVAGISKTVASNIVAFREANGRFDSRKDLLKVRGLGPKAFEQCAGFLRIRGGSEVLDCTAVHPESYDAAKALLKLLGYTREDVQNGGTGDIRKRVKNMGGSKLQKDTGLGEYTLKDIIAELEKPGRDPRKDLPKPVLRQDVLSMEDLKPGMELAGTVRNIVDFGAFVDIGVHQDGLVHISELSDSYVKNPLDVVKVGDIVKVRVLSVDTQKKRIALSMKRLQKDYCDKRQ